jgi:uncharacterized protein YcbX
MSEPKAASPYLASIHLYPLKATRAIDLTESLVEPWGLAGDRRWLLVDDAGRFISQREEASLTQVNVRYAPWPEQIVVSADGKPPVTVLTPSQASGAELTWVTVWRSKVQAAAAGSAADDWFSGFLGREVRLVYLDDPSRREVDPEYGKAGDTVSFADGYPLLLTNMSSLDALGRWLNEDGYPAVPMNRFRPNVVVAEAAAWAEDGWRRIRIGAMTFRVVKPCGRCLVTTIDQRTGERGRQPLHMLGRRRRFGQLLVFGQNLVPDAPGVIRVGEQVQVLE